MLKAILLSNIQCFMFQTDALCKRHNIQLREEYLELRREKLKLDEEKLKLTEENQKMKAESYTNLTYASTGLPTIPFFSSNLGSS